MCFKSSVVCDAVFPLRFREISEVCNYIYLVRFDLPCSTGTLPAPLGKYVNLKATINGEEVIRSYSPISRPSAVGHVDFLIKVALRCNRLRCRRSSSSVPDRCPFSQLFACASM